MSEVLDIETSHLPNTWMHRNPVKAGLLLTLAMVMGLLALSWHLQPALQYMKVKGAQPPNDIKEKYFVLMWIWNVLIFVLVFLPPIFTQYMYRSSRELAIYLALLKRGAFISTFGISSILIISTKTISGWVYTDVREFLFDTISWVMVSVIFALVINLVLAIFFRKAKRINV